MPLYVDSTPAQVVEWMEQVYENRNDSIKTLNVSVISNLGFYDSKQIHIQLAIVKNWCDKMKFTYGGGLAAGSSWVPAAKKNGVKRSEIRRKM